MSNLIVWIVFYQLLFPQPTSFNFCSPDRKIVSVPGEGFDIVGVGYLGLRSASRGLSIYLDEWIEDGRQFGAGVESIFIGISGTAARRRTPCESVVRAHVKTGIVRRTRTLLTFHRLHTTQKKQAQLLL